ncbi:MAG TPA: anaerobic sulfatase maturase [Acetobacteraceae bacterium]|nr:anaerobic sulfatase maturase [Acetobacteraceae bacterium]
MIHGEEILSTSRRLNISPEALQAYLDAGAGKRAAGVTRSLHAMAKPINSACNLDCTYCYYLSKEPLLGQTRRRMSDDILEAYIADYIASQDAAEIAFTWHGGEPTLLGIEFFEKVVRLQRKHTPPGRRVANDLQTNGTLLDDKWCAFLKENGFLVGLSIDGPQRLHDRYRPTKGGEGSFAHVVAAAGRLRRHGIGFGTLSVVNRDTAKHPLEVYRFLRDTIGARYMQLIPCVEPLGFETTAPDAHGDKLKPRTRPREIVTDWSVAPAAWGRFLVAIFDEWAAHDRGRVKINLFESFLLQLNGQPSLMCTSSPFCGKNIAVEHDGSVFSCDHYVYPAHQIGKIGDSSLAEMVFSVRQLEFGLNKFNTLPSECRVCPYLNLCWGECPRTRLLKTREGEGNISYLCEGWKLFYKHAIPAARRLRLA